MSHFSPILSSSLNLVAGCLTTPLPSGNPLPRRKARPLRPRSWRPYRTSARRWMGWPSWDCWARILLTTWVCASSGHDERLQFNFAVKNLKGFLCMPSAYLRCFPSSGLHYLTVTLQRTLTANCLQANVLNSDRNVFIVNMLLWFTITILLPSVVPSGTFPRKTVWWRRPLQAHWIFSEGSEGAVGSHRGAEQEVGASLHLSEPQKCGQQCSHLKGHRSPS